MPNNETRRHIEAGWWCSCDDMHPCAGTCDETTCLSTRREGDRRGRRPHHNPHTDSMSFRAGAMMWPERRDGADRRAA